MMTEQPQMTEPETDVVERLNARMISLNTFSAEEGARGRIESETHLRCAAKDIDLARAEIRNLRAQLLAVRGALEEDQIGPRPLPVKMTCEGCPALRTERWEEYLDNDEHDSGTEAQCTAAKRSITAYWSQEQTPPAWCPARQALSPSPGEGG